MKTEAEHILIVIYTLFFGDAVKRLIGFILFWIAVGMAIMLILPNVVLGVLIIFILLLLGYNLFCC